jgi:hypothetical protein
MKERTKVRNQPSLRRVLMYPAPLLAIILLVVFRATPGSAQAPLLQSSDLQYLGVTIPAPALQLVGYPRVHATLGDGTGTDTRFSLTTRITGLVFPDGTRSVLFFGSSGTGPYCYGPGTSDPILGGTPSGNGVDPWCYDPTNTQKGTHAYPYLYQVWAYDANDLIAVKNGQKYPWDILPYATWNFDLPGSNSLHHVGEAAWDPQTRRLYLAARNSDDAYLVVHAFKVNAGGGSGDNTPPAPPKNLRTR